jgi:pilus assembly protein Flp/PilA
LLILADRLIDLGAVAPFVRRVISVAFEQSILLSCNSWLAWSKLRFNRGFDMSNLFARFLNDESGATAIEYGLIAAGISLAIIGAVNGIGGNLSTKFGAINTSLK